MASPSKMPRIVELAAQISSSVTELQARLTAQGAPSPSWAEDSPESLPADVASLQDAVLDASAELHELLLKPLMLVLRFAAIPNLVSIDEICRYKFPDMIPAGGQLTFAQIAEKTGLEKREVRRLLGHALAMRIRALTVPY